MEKFSACDIQKDGDLDLVYERNNQFFYSRNLTINNDLSSISRVIWFNKDGKFKRVRIEEPFYYRSFETDDRKAIIDHAKNLGTATSRYTPKQQYYEYKKKGNYIHQFRRPIAKPFLDNAH